MADPLIVHMERVAARVLRLRIVRYLISGTLATTTTFVVLFVLVHFFHVWYLLATVVAFIMGVCVSFTMQKLFTFNDYSRDTIPIQTTVFFGIQIFNLSINTLLMYVSVDVVHVHYLLSQVIVAGAIALYSFFVYKHLIFRSKVEIRH